jgi:hypothetical protein
MVRVWGSQGTAAAAVVSRGGSGVVGWYVPSLLLCDGGWGESGG